MALVGEPTTPAEWRTRGRDRPVSDTRTLSRLPVHLRECINHEGRIKRNDGEQIVPMIVSLLCGHTHRGGPQTGQRLRQDPRLATDADVNADQHDLHDLVAGRSSCKPVRTTG